MGSDTQRLQFYEELERRLATVPGVQAVGGITQLPLTGAGGRAQAHIEGHSWGDRKAPEMRRRTVTAGYFDVMDLRLLRGRLYASADRDSDARPLILNQEAATRLFDTRDPVGARLRLGPDTAAPWMSVIGVVENARNESLTEAVQPEVYALHAQIPSGMMTIALRTAVPAAERKQPGSIAREGARSDHIRHRRAHHCTADLHERCAAALHAVAAGRLCPAQCGPRRESRPELLAWLI